MARKGRSEGGTIAVEVVKGDGCIALLDSFVREHPDPWNANIGEAEYGNESRLR